MARDAGDYARRKLDFIEFYCPAAIDATEKKKRRVYIDLFAGPGLNVIRDTREEIDGAALRVLSSVGIRHPHLSFDLAHLVNLEQGDDDALRARVDNLKKQGACKVPPRDIHCLNADANQVVSSLIGQCHQLDYVLVLADIEAPRQLPWTTLKSLKARGHESVDLYMLFPLEMGLSRLMPYGDMPRGHSEIITRFFGTEEWKEILSQRFTEAQAPACRRQLKALYLRQLGTLWQAAEQLFEVKLAGQQGLYRMLFATDHEAGRKIADWARRKAERKDQLGFGPGF